MKNSTITGAIALAALAALLSLSGGKLGGEEFDYNYHGVVPTTSAARFQDPKYMFPPQDQAPVAMQETAMLESGSEQQR